MSEIRSLNRRHMKLLKKVCEKSYIVFDDLDGTEKVLVDDMRRYGVITKGVNIERKVIYIATTAGLNTLQKIEPAESDLKIPSWSITAELSQAMLERVKRAITEVRRREVSHSQLIDCYEDSPSVVISPKSNKWTLYLDDCTVTGMYEIKEL